MDAGSSVLGPNNFYNESVSRRLPQLNPSKPNVRTKNAGDDGGEEGLPYMMLLQVGRWGQKQMNLDEESKQL